MGKRKPNPKDLSPKDRVATAAHLAETISYNAKHSYNHALAAAKLARKIKDPNAETIRHNAEHALKHAKDVLDHSNRFIQHLNTYPGTKSALDELKNPRPSALPKPPGRK